MKKILGLFWHHKIVSIISILIIGFIVFYYIPRNGHNLETQKVKRQNIVQSVTATGKIESETSVKLNFLIPGKLVYVGAKKGDFVKKWQTIAALDTRTVQKNLQDDLIDYMKQRNTFDDTKENNLNRTPEQALNDDMKRILQNNQYDLDKSVISVELQSLAKEQSYLISPIDGVLTSADLSVPGLNAGVTNYFTIADPDHVNLVIEVDESDIGKVKQGLPVKLFLESFPDDAVSLTVTKIDFVSHTSANGGNVFNVEAKIPDNSGYKYRIGMSGDAEITVSDKTGVLTVPIGSIVDDKYVYVKNDKYYEKRNVKLGIQSDIEREVISGLAEGEEVAALPDEAAKMQKENVKKYILF